MENTLNIPKHIAVIPDGNRRWAKQHLLLPWEGHEKGSEILEPLLEVIVAKGIRYASFWGSSKDNLTKRPSQEVTCLLNIFKKYFKSLAEKPIIHRNEIHIDILGAWREQFPEEVREVMENALEKTKHYNKFFVNFFIAYSGTGEMLDAINRIVVSGEKKIDEASLKCHLLTKDLPPVDLLVRTGGEPHNSDGFMMWDTANAQLYFSDKLWPDCTAADLENALSDFASRGRRMGK